MIKFNLNSLRLEYAYISKVTGNYVYVRRNLDDTVYKNPLAKDVMHKGRKAKAVPFEEHFAGDFIRSNPVREFGRAKRAALLWYDNTLIGVEVERGRKPDQDGPWVSVTEQLVNKLPKSLPKDDRPVYCDGQYIFWHTDKHKEKEVKLGVSDHFSLMNCSCINLQQLGYSKVKEYQSLSDRQEQAANAVQGDVPDGQGLTTADGAPDMIDGVDNARITVAVKTRSTLHFKPMSHSEDPALKNLEVISPVLEASNYSETTGKRAVDDEAALYKLGSDTDPLHGSIEFVMRAASVIAKYYGNEAVEFLDIPGIVTGTGHVNFHRIEENIRRRTPIKHRAEDCLAWMLGFVHKEKEISRQRGMTGMFRYVLRKGLVRRHSSMNLVKAGAEDVKLNPKRFYGPDVVIKPAPF